MKVVVIGCGRFGATLAYTLSNKGNFVTIIDQEASAFDILPNDFKGRMIEGDVLTRSTLHRAELEDADALVAVTRSDTLNALIAHIARTEFKVAKVVARNYDPRQQAIQEAFGIPIIGSASWRVQRIEELLSEGPIHTAYSDQKAHFAIYRVEVPAPWHGASLVELLHGAHEKVLSWTRGGQPVQIQESMAVQTGDLIYMSATTKQIEALRHKLAEKQEANP